MRGWPTTLSSNKFYVDDLYNLVIVRPAEGFRPGLAWIDQNVVDGIVDFIGQVPRASRSAFWPIQNGLVQYYALLMVLGLAVFLDRPRPLPPRGIAMTTLVTAAARSCSLRRGAVAAALLGPRPRPPLVLGQPRRHDSRPSLPPSPSLAGFMSLPPHDGATKFQPEFVPGGAVGREARRTRRRWNLVTVGAGDGDPVLRRRGRTQPLAGRADGPADGPAVLVSWTSMTERAQRIFRMASGCWKRP